MNTPSIVQGNGSPKMVRTSGSPVRGVSVSWLRLFPILLALGIPLRAAQPTSFDAVTRQLDPGGTLFVYLSTAQCLADLAGTVDQVRDEVETALTSGGAEESDRANVNRAFNMVSGLISRSGLQSLTGIGMSGLEISDGLYRTRIFAHRSPDVKPGYGAHLFGTAPHPITDTWFDHDKMLRRNRFESSVAISIGLAGVFGPHFGGHAFGRGTVPLLHSRFSTLAMWCRLASHCAPVAQLDRASAF